jgi:hypothetical protein
VEVRIDKVWILRLGSAFCSPGPAPSQRACVGDAADVGPRQASACVRWPKADRAQSSACRLDAFLLATASGRPRARQARAHGCRCQGVSTDDHATRFRYVAVEDLSKIHLVKIGRLCLSRSAGLAEEGGGRQDPASPAQPQFGRRLCPSSRVEAEPAHELVSRRDARRLVVLPRGLAERAGLPVGWAHIRVVSVQQLR